MLWQISTSGGVRPSHEHPDPVSLALLSNPRSEVAAPRIRTLALVVVSSSAAKSMEVHELGFSDDQTLPRRGLRSLLTESTLRHQGGRKD